ncbi:HD domain-containing protein [Brachyspira pilosicoli]|nr:HD domain-containing protein [Brachyspira pilosicoli]
MPEELNIDKYVVLTIDEIKEIKDNLIAHNIPLFRMDKENNIIAFPTEQLSLIVDNPKYSNVKLYAPKTFSHFINEFKLLNTNSAATYIETNKYVFQTPKEAAEEMSRKISEISKMSYNEKVNIIETYNKELKEIKVDEKHTINRNTAQQIVDAGNDVGLIAKVTMFESIKKIKGNEITQDQAKLENQEINDTTTSLVNTIVNMLSKNLETQKVFTELRNFSDGGVMAHSNRVFVSYVNFLAFYNNLIKRRNLIHSIRTSFPTVYKKYYENMTSSSEKYRIYEDFRTLEDCIDNGMRFVEEKEMNLYSIGALLHDIGKVKDLDYFEGESGRDYERIKKHLFNSYTLVSQTSEYSLEVILTVALHHEYYGLGYGPYERLYKLKLEKVPSFQIPRIMSYEAKVIDD